MRTTTSQRHAEGWAPLADAEVSVDPNEPLHVKLQLRTRGGGGSGAKADAKADAKASDAPLTLLLRTATHEEAETWVWALYQCAHGAKSRLEEEEKARLVTIM